MNWFGGRSSRKRKNNNVVVICTVAVIGTSFLVGNISARFGLFIGPDSNKYSQVVKNVEYIDTYEGLFEVRDLLMKNYNGDINDEMLLEGALKGMTASVQDPYTVYMSKKEYEKYLLSNEGIHVGIGITVSLKNDQVAVINVEKDMPADKANIVAGDVILKINDEEVSNSIAKVATLLQGDEGESSKLTMQKADGGTYEVELAKVQIKVDSATGEMIEDNIGYIRLKDFNEKASDSFISALSTLKDSGMKGLIIDLRGNPGGFLTEAEKIASQFIPEGEVITTLKDKYGKEKVSLSKGGIAENIPVVLLIDGNTASASEVITGALRDYGIATTVGTKTYGKGVAQAPYTLENTEGALKITVQKFYTPNGENIHKIGISPDYEVKIIEEDTNATYDRSTDPQYQKALQVIKEKSK
ncbi:S41 family peptidase [Clostridium vincentii]|uniref:Carboxy-terminal processing protease CtpB n=1 Tax=Clostridium vincentii TaxID=52704 RepID=A0A2T0BKF4_9CLOT|nr:S41 family peptidase [Clostridium vincentii]PRR84282.1 Carboxy-terminal processing protease CtpB precursor [Clostridium vincentii]